MSNTRVVLHPGAAFRDVFDQWAKRDGSKRAERVAAAMRAGAPVKTGAYRAGITVMQDSHPTRPAFHIGSTVDYAPIVEADTGNAARALDAAG